MLANPWILLCATLFYVASIASSYWYGHSSGVNKERVVWQQKEREQETRYNALLISTQAKYRELENKRATDAADLSNKYQTEKKTYEKDADTRVANAGKLRDKYARAKTCGNDLPTIGPDPIGVAEAGAELSDQSTQFLLDQAKSADNTVILLNRCIDQLKADRK